MVGTEAALHRVPRADVVAFLDIDQHLLAARFGAGEETLALLARAARLVGAAGRRGRLLVQTRIPGHEVLQAAVHADPTLLSGPERDIRRTLGLPPFGALAVLAGAGGPAYAEGLAAVAGITVSPDGDRWLVRAPDHATLCDGWPRCPGPRAPAGGGRPGRRLTGIGVRRPRAVAGSGPSRHRRARRRAARTMGPCPRTPSGSTAIRC